MKYEKGEKIQTLEPEVIYENKDFVAVNKPAGLLVHANKVSTKEKEETLVDWLVKKYPDIKGVGDEPEMRPGIVHRLDKDTSGVILVAKTQEYFNYLKNLFQEHKIQKTYLALVYGIPKEKKDRIDKPIALKPGTTKRSVHGGKMMKEAVTEYELVSSKEYSEFTGGKNKGKNSYIISLLRVFPKTGRTHQIRVHLASIGCPVLNDPIYAPKKERVETERLMLHALSVEFISKDGKKILIESVVPKEFDEVTNYK